MFSIASIATMSACIFLVRTVLFYRAESAAFCKDCRGRRGDYSIL